MTVVDTYFSFTHLVLELFHIILASKGDINEHLEIVKT